VSLRLEREPLADSERDAMLLPCCRDCMRDRDGRCVVTQRDHDAEAVGPLAQCWLLGG
jgi:hypothetical protein